jgi:hypothetical protein
VLLESSDGTAFGTPTELATATAASDGVIFSNVTLTHNRYYTLATKVIAPGGVASKMIQGLRNSIFVDGTYNESNASPATINASVTNLDFLGAGTYLGAPIFTGYVDRIQVNTTVGTWDDNYVQDFDGYINIPASGSNYVFKLYGSGSGNIDDSAIMWFDQNGDQAVDRATRLRNPFNPSWCIISCCEWGIDNASGTV